MVNLPLTPNQNTKNPGLPCIYAASSLAYHWSEIPMHRQVESTELAIEVFRNEAMKGQVLTLGKLKSGGY